MIRSVVVRGTSMVPFLWPGDVVTVDPVAVPDCRRGCIVVFKPARGQALLVHRVLRVVKGENPHLVTRGDAVLWNDGVVAAERVIGIVSGRQRGRRCLRLRRRHEVIGLAASTLTHLAVPAARLLFRAASPLLVRWMPLTRMTYGLDRDFTVFYLWRWKVAAVKRGATTRVWVHRLAQRRSFLRRAGLEDVWQRSSG